MDNLPGSAMVEDFIPYLDKWGFMTPNKEPSGNGQLFTAEMQLCWIMNGRRLPVEDGSQFQMKTDRCQQDPGIYRRSADGAPFSNDGNSKDNYIGILALSLFYQTRHAWDIFVYGDSHGWNFNNLNHDQWTGWSWFGRDLAFIAHLYHCARIIPQFYMRLAWCASITQAAMASADDLDAHILSSILILCLKERGISNFIENQAMNLFTRKLYSKFPGGMRDVFSKYFGPDHPITKYAWNM